MQGFNELRNNSHIRTLIATFYRGVNKGPQLVRAEEFHSLQISFCLSRQMDEQMAVISTNHNQPSLLARHMPPLTCYNYAVITERHPSKFLAPSRRVRLL